MFVLEALRAKHGDCLLLHWGTKKKPRLAVIDGGPPGVYADALKKRLEQIRKERKLADGESLPIDLAMVSHIDDDHIAGMLELMRKLKALRDAQQPLPWKVRRFWHNSFDDILDNDDVSLGSPASIASVGSLGGLLSEFSSSLLASVGQGRELRHLLEALHLDGNPPFDGLVMTGQKKVTLSGLKLTVVAPLEESVRDLQKEWNTKLKAILKKKKKSAADKAAIAEFLDESPANLSSLVVLAEFEGKRILLTGDGRGDHTLRGLDKAGLLDSHGRIEVDVLKVPHHGSDRNSDESYFRRIRAKHIVISADGKHDNPDIATLEMISKARPDDDFTIHLTYPLDKFTVKSIGTKVAKQFKSDKQAGRSYGVVTRKSADLGLELDLS